ncbi:TPA: fimbrial protein [Citrobacter freundii]|nr:fimbrial protein [Citrobacter freundii]
MLKKTSLTVLATAAMMFGATVSAAPPTTGPFGSGTIHFTGTITNSPCTVAPGDDALVVSFGQISYRQLSAANDTTPSQPIVIRLTQCAFDPDTGATNPNPIGLMSKVKVSFSGTGTTDNKGYVSTGTAQNVAVQLLKSDNNTVIEANTAMPDGDAQQLQAGDNQLRFFARLLATGAVIPGSVDSTVTYTLTYM